MTTPIGSSDGADPFVGQVVWFRMGRMYGTPPEKPVRAMVTKVHPFRRVDLEIGCEGASQVSGSANFVFNKADLPPAMQGQMACWWSGDLPELSGAES